MTLLYDYALFLFYAFRRLFVTILKLAWALG